MPGNHVAERELDPCLSRLQQQQQQLPRLVDDFMMIFLTSEAHACEERNEAREGEEKRRERENQEVNKGGRK